jgi:hypothetical protein
MSIFTYHLVKTSYFSALKAILSPLNPNRAPGLLHSETMTCMTLGSSIFSPSRILARQVAFFAQWESEKAIDDFLTLDSFGKKIAKGWHVRLKLIRQWGEISEFKITDQCLDNNPIDFPVVAVTLARMKWLQIPRFIQWGRPVEKLVRDHPGTILSSASIRLPQTVSTFSIWKSQKEMIDMVHGHSSVPKPERHLLAMKERERKDFHFEFTTLRFIAVSEFGEWNGQKNIIHKL